MAGRSYNTAGGLTDWNWAGYQYDRFNQMIRMKFPKPEGGEEQEAVNTILAKIRKNWGFHLTSVFPNCCGDGVSLSKRWRGDISYRFMTLFTNFL